MLNVKGVIKMPPFGGENLKACTDHGGLKDKDVFGDLGVASFVVVARVWRGFVMSSWHLDFSTFEIDERDIDRSTCAVEGPEFFRIEE